MGASLAPAPISRLLVIGYCSKRAVAHATRGGDSGQEGGEGGY